MSRISMIMALSALTLSGCGGGYGQGEVYADVYYRRSWLEPASGWAYIPGDPVLSPHALPPARELPEARAFERP